ncbi:MAG: ATP-dependent Clp protease proteolytic subunit [Prevotella sp.]|nr:ATP-dependent Clp protease proteolytic subunit [Prevotella sp.]
MATKNTNYQLHLKGFVGGYDFDADYVDYVLGKNAGKEVHVLIDSLGGKSNTALSIFSAFKRHGNVNVHFVGMNASAATIASLGAKHITMDSSAMYLVHKCSIGFFEWGQMNSDDLQALISGIEQQKADLDKLDANIAQMYAARCKKESAELLGLMKAGGWLTAKEALAWGFVDELTDYEDETAPVLTDAMASAMASAGIPIPNLPRMTGNDQSAIARFFNSLAAFFTGAQRSHLPDEQASNSPNNPNSMKKILTSICAILACEHLLSNDGKVTLDDAQLDSLEAAISTDKQTIQTLQGQVQTLTTEKQQLEADKQTLTATNQQLSAEVATLKQKPADTSSHVVNDQHQDQPQDKTDADRYFESRKNAKDLFNLIP